MVVSGLCSYDAFILKGPGGGGVRSVSNDQRLGSVMIYVLKSENFLVHIVYSEATHIGRTYLVGSRKVSQLYY
jgi:hypothetical protein